MEGEFEESDTASVAPTTSSSTVINTPTRTQFSDDSYEPLGNCDAVPWPGETFMIRDRRQGRVITLKDGKLVVEVAVHGSGGWRWICVDNKGWLGFRNSVSGTYIGHNTRGNFHAKVTHHESHEFFCARRHPDGGYLLLMAHGNKLMKMEIKENGNDLVETENEGTAWEFVKV